MTRPRLCALVAIALVVCLASLAVAVEKKSAQATITAEKFKANVTTGVWEFTGGCRAEIKGADRALMSAPRLVGKYDRSGAQLLEIKAVGPVTFDITTRKDTEGIQRHIVAKCTSQAVYDSKARTVTLSGSPEAIMTAIPETPDVAPTTFTGTKLVLTLKDEVTVEGEGVKFDVEIPPQSDEPKPAQ